MKLPILKGGKGSGRKSGISKKGKENLIYKYRKNTNVYFPMKTEHGYEVDIEQKGKIVRSEVFPNLNEATAFYNENK